MANSKQLAGLIGPTLVALGATAARVSEALFLLVILESPVLGIQRFVGVTVTL